MWKLEPNKAFCMIIGLTDHLVEVSKKKSPIEQAVQKENSSCPIRMRIHRLLSKQQHPIANRKKPIHLYLGNEGGFVTQSKKVGYSIPLHNSPSNTWYFCWHDSFIRILKQSCHHYNYTITRLVHWPTELATRISNQNEASRIIIRSQNHTLYVQYEANLCVKTCLIQQQTPKDIHHLIEEYLKHNNSTLYLLSHEIKDRLYLNEAGINFENLRWDPNTWSFLNR